MIIKFRCKKEVKWVFFFFWVISHVMSMLLLNYWLLTKFYGWTSTLTLWIVVINQMGISTRKRKTCNEILQAFDCWFFEKKRKKFLHRIDCESIHFEVDSDRKRSHFKCFYIWRNILQVVRCSITQHFTHSIGNNSYFAFATHIIAYIRTYSIHRTWDRSTDQKHIACHTLYALTFVTLSLRFCLQTN